MNAVQTDVVLIEALCIVNCCQTEMWELLKAVLIEALCIVNSKYTSRLSIWLSF